MKKGRTFIAILSNTISLLITFKQNIISLFLRIYIFDRANVFLVEVISARDVESLVKTAFPLQNENIGKCLWAMVEEQDHNFLASEPHSATDHFTTAYTSPSL